MYPGDGQPPQQPQQPWGGNHQQPAYQGFGLYQQPGGEPPRKRGNLVVVISIVALVAIIGAVVTIVLLNRGGNNEAQPQDAPPVSTERAAKPPTTAPSQRTTANSADPLQPRNAGWSVIKNEKAKLIYEVPPAWTPLPNGTLKSTTMPDVVLSFPAALSEYQCEGKGYSRGGLGAGTVAKSDPAQAATNIAKAFGAEFYASSTPKVDAGPPKQVTSKAADGKSVKGVQVDATVTTAANACLASKGKVSVLVLEGAAEYQFLVVNGDITGGPATPPPPTEADLQKIVDSARGY